jgi:hypothetical protein
MTEFNKGDRIIFVRDDVYYGIKMPKGTLATYDDDSPTHGTPSVVLDTGERVAAWRSRIAPAEPETPAPLDPSKVKPGDTVTLERDGGRLPDQEVVVVTSTERGWIIFILKGAVEVRVTGPDPWLITAHQPATEPESEWKPGTVAAVTYVGFGWVDEPASFDGAHWRPLSSPTEKGVFKDNIESPEDVRPLFVIDPATVDAEALQAAIDGANGGAEARAVLQFLGIEAAR